MKKIITIMVAAFFFGNASYAQIDRNKRKTDSINTQRNNNNNKNDNRNKDSVNREKKMPPKDNTAVQLNDDSNTLSQKINTKTQPAQKPRNDTNPN